MLREYPRSSLERVASLALLRMEGLIEAMERAAGQVERGTPPEEVAPGDYRLYVVREGDRYLKVACVLSADDYFQIISSAADEAGEKLEEMVDLRYRAPEMEFDENMVTGWFHAFKGASVEVSTAPMEELLDCVTRALRSRGLTAGCGSGEEVVFFLPIRGQGTRAREKTCTADP